MYLDGEHFETTVEEYMPYSDFKWFIVDGEVFWDSLPSMSDCSFETDTSMIAGEIVYGDGHVFEVEPEMVSGMVYGDGNSCKLNISYGGRVYEVMTSTPWADGEGNGDVKGGSEELYPSSSWSVVDSGEGKVQGTAIESIEGALTLEKLYEDEGIVLKSKEYLDVEYYDYEQLFSDIVSLGDEPFSVLDPNDLEYIITLDMLDENFTFRWELGIYSNTVLDDYDVIDIGLYAGVDPIGAVAVFCYDDTKVIYLLDTEKPSFFVVDYAGDMVFENTDMVQFGSVFGSALWFVREKTNKMQIDGYDVYFSYNIIVDEDWK